MMNLVSGFGFWVSGLGFWVSALLFDASMMRACLGAGW